MGIYATRRQTHGQLALGVGLGLTLGLSRLSHLERQPVGQPTGRAYPMAQTKGYHMGLTMRRVHPVEHQNKTAYYGKCIYTGQPTGLCQNDEYIP